MKYSIAIEERVHKMASSHLIRKDGQEDLCFALWSPAKGENRFSALIYEIILPKEGERNVHGNVSFNSQYLERVFDLALSKGKGIVFIHSHPFPGWQNMSQPDIIAEKERLASRVYAVTNLPLVGMTLGTDEAWSARFWIKQGSGYQRFWCENVRVVGDKLSITFDEKQLPLQESIEELKRTISTWGNKTQSDIARVKVGIIGLGSVGSIVVETLSKMGIFNVLHLDFDTLESKNLDRTLGATKADIGKAKVKVIADSISKSSPHGNLIVETSEYSICEEKGFRQALDCDVLFSCVDRPWPRFILNIIAHAYLIPVIDGGIRAKSNANNTAIKSADWRAHTISSTRICLECIGQYDSALVEAEKSGLIDKPEYIEGVEKDNLIGGSENVFAFSLSLASLEIQQFLSLIIAPHGIKLNPKIYHFTNGSLEDDKKVQCHENCLYKDYTALGDHNGLEFTGTHEVAEQARKSRLSKLRSDNKKSLLKQI